MLTAGIDCGAKFIKIVLLEDSKILLHALALAGFDTNESANKLLDDILAKANLEKKDIKHITSTGAGRKDIDFANNNITEVTADAKGAIHLYPGARTVIDVGAEEGRGIRCDATGKVIDFAINEKCAAGAGAFTEAMARALEIKLEDMGPLSLKSTKSIPMNAQCAIFAESEVVSLLHAKTPKEDIARAIHDAIASRIISMVRKVGLEKDIILIGGVAKNIGFVDSMKKGLELEIIIPEHPEYVGALGAAIYASEQIKI